VRSAAPADAEEEVILFAPHLLVHDDTAGVDPRVLEGIQSLVEMLYSDSMGARVSVDGRVEENPDISMDVLLRVADDAAAGIREH
jgi:ABC-type lipopolysaccharide export system ATPase subunit